MWAGAGGATGGGGGAAAAGAAVRKPPPKHPKPSPMAPPKKHLGGTLRAAGNTATPPSNSNPNPRPSPPRNPSPPPLGDRGRVPYGNVPAVGDTRYIPWAEWGNSGTVSQVTVLGDRGKELPPDDWWVVSQGSEGESGEEGEDGEEEE